MDLPSAEASSYTAESSTSTWNATTVSILKITGISFLALAVIITNSIVLLTIVFKGRTLLKSFPKHLVASLATADLLIGLVVVPLNGIITSIGRPAGGNVLCTISSVLDMFLISSSVTNLSVITLLRYARAHYPFECQAQVTHRVKTGIVIGTWTTVLIICVSMVLIWPNGYRGKCVEDFNQDPAMSAALVAAFSVAFFVIVIGHCKVYNTLTRTRPNIRRYGGERIPWERKRILALVVGGFTFCWLPYVILHMFIATGIQFGTRQGLYGISIWLGYCNSLLNPTVVVVTSDSLVKAIKLLLFNTRI